MTRPRTARMFALTTGAVTAAMLAAGCTTTISGHPNRESGAPASGGQTATGGGDCARSATPQNCVAWQNTTPATGSALFDKAKQDPVTATQMLCSALPAEAWDRYLQPGNYRIVEDGTSCSVWSGDDQVAVKIGLDPGYSLTEYLQLFRSKPDVARDVSELTIAGKRVMRVAATYDADGKGNDRDELSIAPTTDPAAKGVLQVHLVLRPPRGSSKATPVDRTRIDGIRDAVVGDLLKVLFPQR
ncbi:hypothetical protein FKR81_37480 [Lentzea tibetensis]|uniref:DUF3558 domain-containing protein n=1 Tax=Lentzea tibetensis TaxID=2591470 RepID=A0A563EHZ3_9PSEU|nr:hypothetical protein [Lentzea tibetensis]TWP46062.1 hypothetical protein FKR81_37480 [Lentzea tibetensis]